MNNLIFSRALAIAAVATAITLASALPASAHVTIDDNSAEAGSYSLLTFKVPTESDSASTTGITISFPSADGLGATYVPVAGWNTTVTSTDETTSIEYTAGDGSGILPGQMQLFPVSFGAIPDTGSIVFSVDQAYDDGTVVSWNEEGDDAEHPAPVLYVNDEPAEDHHADSGSPEVAASPAGTEDVTARIIAVVSLLVAAVAIALAIVARRKP